MADKSDGRDAPCLAAERRHLASDRSRPSRRELIKRVGLTAGVLAGSALIGTRPLGSRRLRRGDLVGARARSATTALRDRADAELAELAIAKQKDGEPEPTAGAARAPRDRRDGRHEALHLAAATSWS